MTCFDVNYLNETVVVVECLEKSIDAKEGIKGDQLFYLIDVNRLTPYKNKGLTFSLTSEFLDRKSMAYHRENVTFLITALIYDELLDKAESEESYLQVYVWNQNAADEANPLGKLRPHSLIMKEQLGSQEDLQVMDFDIQDDWIIILDYSKVSTFSSTPARPPASSGT